MTAAINFFAGINQINNLSGSGLGFFGATSFGASVAVGAWQGRTFVTDGNGVNQGPEANNCQYLNAQSGILGQAGSGINLLAMPNYQASLNVQFTNDTPVKAQNVQLYIYDRTSINNAASGVTTAVGELIHPGNTQVNTGSGSKTWQFPAGTGYMTLSPSPGISGIYAGNGSNGGATSLEHDWYLALSASPITVGAKNLYGLYVSLEYL